MKLNDEQQKAVNHIDGPLLVLAGAGSGKTRIVTNRIAHLIAQGISPKSIVAVTFTNKAAGEMLERVQQQTTAGYSGVIVSTFHSLAVRILRESIGAFQTYTQDFVIYDQEDSLRLLRDIMKQMELKDKEVPVKSVKSLISRAKNALEGPDDVSEWEEDKGMIYDYLPRIYRRYQDKLLQSNAVDFDDLLMLTARLFAEYPDVLAKYQERWRYLLIDEYQDTNVAQYRIALALVQKSNNIFVVGDPDQSIYSWRGADIDNIMRFEEDFPGATVVRIEQNYRSTATILDAANALIANNSHRFEKNLWSTLGRGEKIKIYRGIDEHAEARFVMDRIEEAYESGCSYDDIVIFYRTNFQSRLFEDALLRRNVPYVIVGGTSFYMRREIKDILAWIRMVLSGNDVVAFSRTINLPKRGIGPASLERIIEAAETQGQTLLECIEWLGSGNGSIRLSAKQRQALLDYAEIVRYLRQMTATKSLSDLMSECISATRYELVLREDRETEKDRWQNIQELVGKAEEWEREQDVPTLEGFLEEISLKSSVDEATDVQARVHLMTLHNGKGLEFPVTFMVGMEEDLFPHINTKNSEAAIEEERRLCYVGMTRAKEQLYLTGAAARFLWGARKQMTPSRFLKEIPDEYVHRITPHKPISRTMHAPPPQPREQEESKEFVRGDQVRHGHFGQGTILSVSNSGSGVLYEVAFKGAREPKLLAAQYAKLSPV